MKEREIEILKLLTKSKKMTVAELARSTEVSQVTIRKDLDRLEDEKMIIREHGYARLNDSDDLSMRLSQNHDQKYKIAKEALKQIEDGDTIIIESGSCCAILSKEISKNKENVMIITNSAFIADYIRDSDSTDVILLGGIYQDNSQVTVGPMVRKCLESFFVDKLFVGVDGYTPEHGFTGSDYLRSEVVNDMVERAESVIVITDSSKFGRRSKFKLFDTSKVKYVITDENIPKSMIESLEKTGWKSRSPVRR